MATLRKSDEFIYETDTAFVLVDQDWAVKGHTLIVWKEHLYNISQLSQKEYASFSKLVYQTEKVLLRLSGKDKSLILKSGGLIQHLHFHIYPLDQETSWEETKAILDKKIRYNASESERTSFLNKFITSLSAEIGV